MQSEAALAGEGTPSPLEKGGSSSGHLGGLGEGIQARELQEEREAAQKLRGMLRQISSFGIIFLYFYNCRRMFRPIGTH